MDGRVHDRASSGIIGVAGRCSSEQEKSYVKQAVFLLRYRIRFLAAERDPPPAPLVELD